MFLVLFNSFSFTLFLCVSSVESVSRPMASTTTKILTNKFHFPTWLQRGRGGSGPLRSQRLRKWAFFLLLSLIFLSIWKKMQNVFCHIFPNFQSEAAQIWEGFLATQLCPGCFGSLCKSTLWQAAEALAILSTFTYKSRFFGSTNFTHNFYS